MDMNAFDAYRFCILHTKTDRWIRLCIAQALEPVSITTMEWLLLESLQKNTSDGTSITAASEALGVSLPQVTALTHRLQKQGALSQRVSAKDKRSHSLSITPQGAQLYKTATKLVEAKLIEQAKQTRQLRVYRDALQALGKS